METSGDHGYQIAAGNAGPGFPFIKKPRVVVLQSPPGYTSR